MVWKVQRLSSSQEIIVHKKEKLLILVIIFLVLLFYGGEYLLSTQGHEYTFLENDAYISNPDRGIYVQIEAGDIDDLEEYLQLEGKEDIRVILLTFDLEGYENTNKLPEEKLNELEEALNMVRQNHISVIFRAAYTFESLSNDPSDIDVICKHTEQISEILMEFEEDVLCIQAGMLGPWGEWHSSEHIDTAYTIEAHKVLMTWLDNTKGIEVALRRPTYLRDAISMGADESRLTLHNDALLASDDDMGTYKLEEYSREEEIEYIGNLSTVYMGGEMNQVSMYTEISYVVEEFDKLDIAYLNRYYNQEVWRTWEEQTFLNEKADEYVTKHLGYRLSLSKVKWNDFIFFQQMKVFVNNTGFGELDSRYRFYLTIDSCDGREVIELKKKEVGVYQGLFSYSFRQDQNYDLGIVITRRSLNELISEYGVQLANDEIEYQDGINYFLEEYQK